MDILLGIIILLSMFCVGVIIYCLIAHYLKKHDEPCRPKLTEDESSFALSMSAAGALLIVGLTCLFIILIFDLK